MTTRQVSYAPSLLRQALRFLYSERVPGWADQVVISGTNFLVLLLIARWTDAGNLGLYAIGFSIVIIAMVAQDSLVTRPYSIQIFKPNGDPKEHASGILVLGILVSISCGTLVGLVAFALAVAGSSGPFVSLLATLACTIPMMLWRDFARRFAFANLKTWEALVLDTVSSITLIAALWALSATGVLTANTALAAMAASYGLAAIGWVARNRQLFSVRAARTVETAYQSWMLGRWLLFSQIALQVQGYAAHWITFLVAGAATTGLYAACLSIVGLANPFLFGLFNILTPRFVRILKEGGSTRLVRAALRESVMVGAVMGGFTLLLLLGGEWLIGKVFTGGEFSGHGKLLALLALASAIAAVGAPATIALSAAERGRAIAGLSSALCLVGSICVWLMLVEWGLVGAAVGIVLTESAGTLMRWYLLIAGSKMAEATTSPHSHSTEHR